MRRWSSGFICLPAPLKGIKSVSAVRRLKAEMKQLGSDAKVELFPANHFTVMTPAHWSRIDHEMAATAK